MTPRDRLRAHVMDSVAKSGSGAVLVSAGEVAALFADYDALAAREAHFGKQALEALDGRSEGDPAVLARVEAVAALLQVAESPQAYAEAWAEDPESMLEVLGDTRELVRCGRLALAGGVRADVPTDGQQPE